MDDSTRSAPAPATPVWHALFIGVDRYLSPIPPLSGCVNDADSVRRFLVSRVAPDAKVRMLAASRGEAPGGAGEANAANIRQAFEELAAEVDRGHNVLIYYACHGVRVENKKTRQRFYGFAPTDTGLKGAELSNLILAQELNSLLRKLSVKGASATVLADTCHAAMGSRTVGEVVVERRFDLDPLSEEDWGAFVQGHPSLRGDEPPVARDDGGARALGEERSGWAAEPRPGDEWVYFSACRDVETAKETTWQEPGKPGPADKHGAFTAGLLNAFNEVPAEKISSLRWTDIKSAVIDFVRTRFPGTQTPALEGRPERAVFGGAWTPFDPGFTVQPGKGAGLVELDGGLMHSLEPGAEVAIYPPDTASFAKADAAGVRPIQARIESAEPSRSVARILDAEQAIAPLSRARLSKPGPSWRPLQVALIEVPADVAKEIATVKDAAQELVLNPPAGSHDVEVRPRAGKIPLWGWSPWFRIAPCACGSDTRQVQHGYTEAGRLWQGHECACQGWECGECGRILDRTGECSPLRGGR